MTTFCTLFGLLPLALGLGAGAELQKPLALAVIGGLALSTPVTLLVVPGLYAAIKGAQMRPSPVCAACALALCAARCCSPALSLHAADRTITW